jgi:DNA-binding MarR family transcriptional regulator
MAAISEYSVLLDLLLRHQRRLQAITIGKGPPLDLLENHILSFLDLNSQTTASDLVAALGVEKSTISRALSDLERRGYVSSRADAADRRRFLLKVTAAGEKTLRAANEKLSAAMAECVAPLSGGEETKLANCFRDMADAFNCAPAVSIKDLHPLLQEARRLSKPFGIIGAQFAATELSAMEFQILAVTEKASDRICARDLCSMLGLTKSLVSRALARLQELRLVALESNPDDARSSFLLVTPKGKHLLQKTVLAASDSLAQALKPKGPEFVKRFCELLARYAVDTPNGLNSSLETAE